jgi:hypothetical protein
MDVLGWNLCDCSEGKSKAETRLFDRTLEDVANFV